MTNDDVKLIETVLDSMFPKVLGMRIVEASKERVRAELTVTDALCTTGKTMHGGAVMTFADCLGASLTFLNLPPGAGTTTLESKSNFLTAAKSGEKVTATAEPVHIGKSTHVLRTTVTREDGRTVAVVTQTQMVLQGATGGSHEPMQLIMSLFTGKSLDEQKALLAQLERGGAAMYRAWAAEEKDEAVRAELLAAAEREMENAETLEK